MIDFKEIIKATDSYNFHSHTQFCDGRASMAEFAKAAVEAGFRHYGFSPHSPISVESPCNMSRDSVSEYMSEFHRLKEEYSGRINFYAAMEIDYIDGNWGPSNPYFDTVPLDYRIGSVHFVPTQDGEPVDVDGSVDGFKRKMASKFNDDIRYVVNKFYDQSMDMLAAGGFDIIGHFDKIGHNASHYCPGIEDEPWYQARVNELIDAILQSGVAVEINTKAREKFGRFFPNERYWKRLKEGGATILVNSDAHYTERINASRAEALKALKLL